MCIVLWCEKKQFPPFQKLDFPKAKNVRVFVFPGRVLLLRRSIIHIQVRGEKRMLSRQATWCPSGKCGGDDCWKAAKVGPVVDGMMSMRKRQPKGWDLGKPLRLRFRFLVLILQFFGPIIFEVHRKTFWISPVLDSIENRTWTQVQGKQIAQPLQGS